MILASFLNLAGPDLIFILLILGLLIGSVVSIVRFAVRMIRKQPPGSEPVTQVEARLRKLEELKAKGLLTNEEYEGQRQKIISHI